MDPHTRRRATAAAAGLTCALAAVFGTLALVLRSEPAGAAPSPAAPAAAPAARVAPVAPVATVAPGRAAPDARLAARIRARIADAIERAASETKGRVASREVAVSVHVREATRDELVAIESDRPMRPASNLKLVTSSAALVLLGADWRFDTVIETNGSVENGSLRGDLVARAGGDPLYERNAAGKGDGSVDALLAPAALAIAGRGIRAVDGALVLDELDYAPPSPAPGWPDANQRWAEFCALAGGFSANAGCLTATVKPGGGAGDAAEVRVEPRHCGLERKGRVTTGAAKSKLDVRVEARNGSVLVDGSIPKSVPSWSTRFAAPDPVDLFGTALAGALAERGVTIARGIRRAHAPVVGRWTELARLSTPIASVIDAMNTDSNNACADQMFLALGHARGGAGTREGGRAAVARALERLGVPADGLVQVDGSGLSRDNRVTARQITTLIDAVLRLDEKTARAFVDSMAIASESGTLDDRMRDPKLAGRVRAKTGFIAGTSALSGILETKDGRRLVFSILVEYPPTDGLNRTCWKPMEDAICAELAGADG